METVIQFQGDWGKPSAGTTDETESQYLRARV